MKKQTKTTEQLLKDLAFLKVQINTAKSYELGDIIQEISEIVCELKRRGAL